MVFQYASFARDALRLTRRLSLPRLWNFVLIYMGLWLSKLSGRVMVFGRPFAVSVEVSAVCNLRCPECIVGQGKTFRESKKISKALFGKTLERYRRHAFYANLYFQGEPFLHRELHLLAAEAFRMGYYTSVSTNGHFLDELRCREIIESGLDRLIVSVDGLDQETYAFYRRGGQLKKVLEGVGTLVRIKKEMNASHPLVVLQFLVNRRNEGQIARLRKFAGGLGADVLELKTMQVYDEAGSQEFLPANSKYNRYQRVRKNNGPCYRLWSHAVFTSDGVLVPCCYDKVPQHPAGNISGEDPWTSPELIAFRKKVMQGRENIDICGNCAE